MRYLNQLPRKLLVALPLLAVLTIVGYGASRTVTVGAQQDPKQTRIEALEQKLKDAVADAQKNGEFTTDRHGERVYAGKTAEDMKRLEKEVGNEIRELTARPAEERAKTIDAINTWNDKFLYTVEGQPKQHVSYGGRPGNVQGFKSLRSETYYSEDYSYSVTPDTNKVLEVYMRAKEKGEPQAFEDMTPRYTEAQLEQQARKLVEAQNLGVDLNSLQLEKGHKVGTYFFMWYGQKNSEGQTPRIQVGLTQGGQLIGYTNAGFFEGL